MKLVDLSAKNASGHWVDCHVVPEHVAAVTDDSGSYWESSIVTLVGGRVVRPALSSEEVRERLEKSE